MTSATKLERKKLIAVTCNWKTAMYSEVFLVRCPRDFGKCSLMAGYFLWELASNLRQPVIN